MTDTRQSTKNYTQPHPVPASDTLVLGAAKATSYGPRVKPYNDGIAEPAKSGTDADFWSVYEWWSSRHAPKGGWWEWRADCDTENVARTLAEAIAGVAQQPAARPPKPTECMNGCPDRQVCDHCQWPPGPDKRPSPPTAGKEMSHDRYERIRKALAMGPTPGPWDGNDNSVSRLWSNGATGIREYIALPDGAECSDPNPADMHWIAACDPDTIHALLEERDALVAENARLRQALEALSGQRGEPDWHAGKQREDAIAALRERLGEGE